MAKADFFKGLLLSGSAVSNFVKGWNIVKGRLQKRRIKNFSWIVSWEITHKCNLRCQYCFVDFQRKNPDPSFALETILDLCPHMLLISGGEPLLVPDLPDIMERIYRECQQPHMVITTNLSVHKKVVLPILPYIHTLHVSIDGIGGHNKRQRGIPAEKILDNIRAVVSYKAEHKLELPQILTATIVTDQNYRDVSKLVETLYSIDPTIIMTFGAVEPQEHPMSLVQNQELCREFYDIFWTLKKDYPVEIVGILGNRLTRDKERKERADIDIDNTGPKCVNCYRQYFRTVVKPDGTIYPCKPGRYLEYYQGNVFDAAGVRDMKRLFSLGSGVMHDIVFRPYNPVCYFPCKCEEFLDDIIMARSKEELPPQAEFFKNRIDGDQGRETERFIRKHFNPHFRLDFLR